MRTISMAIAFALSFALSAPTAEAKSKYVKQPAYSVSTNCLPKQLKYYLGEVNRRFGKVRVISSFRRGAVIAGTRKRSKHASCQAVDFKVAGNQNAAARWLKTQPIEVITYSGLMSHIHIATASGKPYRGHKVVGSSKKKKTIKNRRKR